MMKIQPKKKSMLYLDPLKFRFSAEKAKWSRDLMLSIFSSKKVIVACDYHLYKSVAHFCILRNGSVAHFCILRNEFRSDS